MPLNRHVFTLRLWHDTCEVSVMIGNKLKELRKQKQITQNDLAHLLGTNVKSIRNWEDDISDPNLQSFCKILKVYGTDNVFSKKSYTFYAHCPACLYPHGLTSNTLGATLQGPRRR